MCDGAARRGRARTSKAGKPWKGRDHARATCREWLQKVDAEKPETHPLKLQDLSFQVLSRFLNTFKKKAKTRSSSGDEDETVSVRLSQSAFDGATSALSYLYTECGVEKFTASKDLWTRFVVYK